MRHCVVMRTPSYVFRRPSGIYYFRWVVPANMQTRFPTREIRRTLHTNDQRTALQRARRLLVCLDQINGSESTVANDDPAFRLLVGSFTKRPDGSVEAKDIQLDPDKAEAELKLLQGV